MKKVFTILLFVFICYRGYSQTWQSIPNFGGVVRARSGAFSIGDTGYIIAGGNTWYVPSAWGYDSLSQQWFQIADYPGNDDDPICFSINGKGYCVTGGTCCPGYSNSLYEYDPFPNNTWTALTPLPGQARTFSVGFAISGKLYVGGGVNDSATASNSNPLKDFWQYDPSSATWTRIADCPAAGVNAFAVGFAINGKGYVGTGGMGTYGSSSYVPQQDFWEYDPSSNTWTPKANFGGGVRAGAVAWATCDKGYVGTGYTDINQSILTNDMWQYDPVKDAWTQISSYAGVPRMFASAFVIGNSGFVGNGGNPNADLLDFYEYHADYIPSFITDKGDSGLTICAGQSISFTDSSNYTPDHWFWQFPGGKPGTDTTQNPTVEYDTAGTWNVIFSAWNGCDSATKTYLEYVTVGVGGTLTITPPLPTVCNGQSVTLKVSGGGVNFMWSPSSGLNNTTGDSVTANPTISTRYVVSGSDSLGCKSTGTDSITVNVAPSLTILPQPPPTFCNGLSAMLMVSGGGENFTWNPSLGLSATTGDSVIASPSISTTYTVTGMDSAGCVATGTEAVNVILSPNKPTFTQDGDTLISSSRFDNQWYRNDTLLQNDTSQDLIITSSGQYWVIVNNEANGCSTSSDSMQIKTGINQLSLMSNQLSIYPNPFNSVIFIKINSSAENVNDWNLEIADVLGRTIFTRSSLNYSNEIDLSALSSGVYFITVINKTGRAVFPVMKQN